MSHDLFIRVETPKGPRTVVLGGISSEDGPLVARALNASGHFVHLAESRGGYRSVNEHIEAKRAKPANIVPLKIKRIPIHDVR